MLFSVDNMLYFGKAVEVDRYPESQRSAIRLTILFEQTTEQLFKLDCFVT